VTPSLQLGVAIGFLTTTATMIAFINAFVAGAGITLLSRHLLGFQARAALMMGLAAAVGLVAVFFVYQKWRFRLAEPAAPATPPARQA
jgi:hypothetical protein